MHCKNLLLYRDPVQFDDDQTQMCKCLKIVGDFNAQIAIHKAATDSGIKGQIGEACPWFVHGKDQSGCPAYRR